MPFVPAVFTKRFSDLVVHEIDPAVGSNRRDINVTPPATDPVQMGQVVFRAISSDLEAPYAVLSAAAQLVATNEFAIVFGDHFSFNPEFKPRAVAAGSYNAVAIVGNGNAIQLKEFYVKQVAQDAEGAALTDAQFETLRGLLEAQGIQLLKTL